MMNKIDLYNLNIAELIEFFEEIGETPFRAKRLYKYLYREGIYIVDDMSDLPAQTRQKLKEYILPQAIELTNHVSSIDTTTKKFLFETVDKNYIETVFMKHKDRNSICISSQIGCKMGCTFCASGSDGFVRNLSASEMLLQIILAEKEAGEQVKNIVIMGIGEPLDNYENIKKFIEIFSSEFGRDFSRKQVTISTCGIVPMITALAKDMPQVNLAISLHAPNDKIRKQIMPISKKYSMEMLIEAIKKHYVITRKRTTIEYILISGFNDLDSDAEELAKLLCDMNCIVNLIPLNNTSLLDMKGSSEDTTQRFREILGANGVPATIRTALGSDIDAACGQLRLLRQQKNAKS